MRGLYTALFSAVLPAICLRAAVRSRRDVRYRQHFSERLGRWPEAPPVLLWVHAVSMGEVRALRTLVPMLLATGPETRLLLTVTTPAGRAAAEDLFPERVEVRYLPLDLPVFIAGVFRQRRPRALLLVEAELWPNLIACAQQACIPVLLVNARLSARSARRYARLGGLTRPLFEGLTRVLAQTAADAHRFVEAGVSPERIEVLGSLKFDRPADAPVLPRVEPRPCRIGLGCLRRGEEGVVFDAIAQLREQIQALSVVLVTRQVGDAEFFMEVLRERALPAVHAHDCRPEAWEPSLIVVVDAVGVLETVYQHCRVAFVGGALIPLGGHSVADAALAGCPLVTGPHHENNLGAVEALLEARSARVVNSAEEIVAALEPWLCDADMAACAGSVAQATIEKLAGASARTLQALGRLGIVDVHH